MHQSKNSAGSEQNVYTSKLLALFIPTQPKGKQMQKMQKRNAIDLSSHDSHPNLDSNQSAPVAPVHYQPALVFRWHL